MKTFFAGFLAVAPLFIYVFLLFTFFSVSVLQEETAGSSVYLPYLMVAAPVVWGILVYYTIHVMRNVELETGNKRALWLIGIASAGMIVLPIYWVRFMARKSHR
jgi:hypothetical protein